MHCTVDTYIEFAILQVSFYSFSCLCLFVLDTPPQINALFGKPCAFGLRNVLPARMARPEKSADLLTNASVIASLVFKTTAYLSNKTHRKNRTVYLVDKIRNSLLSVSAEYRIKRIEPAEVVNFCNRFKRKQEGQV